MHCLDIGAWFFFSGGAVFALWVWLTSPSFPNFRLFWLLAVLNFWKFLFRHLFLRIFNYPLFLGFFVACYYEPLSSSLT